VLPAVFFGFGEFYGDLLEFFFLGDVGFGPDFVVELLSRVHGWSVSVSVVEWLHCVRMIRCVSGMGSCCRWRMLIFWSGLSMGLLGGITSIVIIGSRSVTSVWLLGVSGSVRVGWLRNLFRVEVGAGLFCG
jgi:hypothetical protein